MLVFQSIRLDSSDANDLRVEFKNFHVIYKIESLLTFTTWIVAIFFHFGRAGTTFDIQLVDTSRIATFDRTCA